MATAWTRLPFRNLVRTPFPEVEQINPDLRSNRLIPDLTSSFRSISDLRSNNSVINAALKIEERGFPLTLRTTAFLYSPGTKASQDIEC
jgi:hypothetical protein